LIVVAQAAGYSREEQHAKPVAIGIKIGTKFPANKWKVSLAVGRAPGGAVADAGRPWE